MPCELTWSRYRSERPACGTCDARALRLEAFQDLDEYDPPEYADRSRYADV